MISNTEPTLTDVLSQVKNDVMINMHCAMIGEIQSFDPDLKTASVQISFKSKSIDGSTSSRTILVDCPVFTLQGGGGSLRFPIEAGDQCLVIFSDRNIDKWLQNGGEAEPADARLHSVSDGIALVGLNALNSDLEPYEASTAVLGYSGLNLRLSGGLLKVANTSQDLLTVLTALITALDTLTVTVAGSTGTVSPATVTALNAVKTQLQGLLYT